jgi:hypothetical protein
MSSASTEGTLRDWRYGNTQAERLCAALLHLESFEDVNPQHPLGGPDGLKDVRCNRNGKMWIAAAFGSLDEITSASIPYNSRRA